MMKTQKMDPTLAALATAPTPEDTPDLASTGHGGTRIKKPKPPTKMAGFRITLASHRALLQAALDDGISGTSRVQAMFDLWLGDADVRAKIDERAAEISNEVKSRR